RPADDQALTARVERVAQGGNHLPLRGRLRLALGLQRENELDGPDIGLGHRRQRGLLPRHRRPLLVDGVADMAADELVDAGLRGSLTLFSPLIFSHALLIASSATSWGTTTVPSTSAKMRSPGRTVIPPQRIGALISTTSILPSESYGVSPRQNVGKPSSTIS